METILQELALSLAAETLLEAILEAKDRAAKYETILINLQRTLELVTPKIKRIEQLKESRGLPLDDVQNLKLQLENGKVLVNKCSEVGCCNFFKKQRYAKKLIELDDSLKRHFNFELPLILWEETSQIMGLMITGGSRRVSGRISGRNGWEVKNVVTRLRRIVQSVPNWIIFYLGSILRFRRWNYQRITQGFCPEL